MKNKVEIYECDNVTSLSDMYKEYRNELCLLVD